MFFNYLNPFKKQKSLGLSLRGGMARCGGYVGILKALEEENIKVDVIVGSSMGAIIGACHAIGLSTEEMFEAVKNLNMRRFLSLESLRDFAIIGDSRAEDLIGDIFKGKKIEDTNTKLLIQVSNVETRNCEYLTEGDLVSALTASAAFPFLIRPIKIKGKLYIDGDITAGFGADKLRDLGVDKVIGLSVGKHTMTGAHHENPINRFIDSITMSTHIIREQDLELNPLDLLINDLGLDVSPFGFDRANYLFDHGYRVAQDMMPTIKRILY